MYVLSPKFSHAQRNFLLSDLDNRYKSEMDTESSDPLPGRSKDMCEGCKKQPVLTKPGIKKRSMLGSITDCQSPVLRSSP